MDKTIRQSVGIDCDKEQLVCEFVNEDESGKVQSLSCKTVKNKEGGFKELLKWVRKLQEKETTLSVVMEATGVYHQSAAVFLHSNGMDIKVVLPNKAMHFQKTITLFVMRSYYSRHKRLFSYYYSLSEYNL